MPLTAIWPFSRKIWSIMFVRGTVVYHFFNVTIHRVFELGLWDDLVMKLSASILYAVKSCSLALFPLVLVLFEMEYVKKCLISFLFLVIWPNNNSKEWQSLPLEFNLLLVMGLQILKWGIDLKYWMTMIPG